MEKYLRFRGKVEASQDQCYHIMRGTFFKIDAQSHCLAKSLQDKFGSFYIISVFLHLHHLCSKLMSIATLSAHMDVLHLATASGSSENTLLGSEAKKPLQRVHG